MFPLPGRSILAALRGGRTGLNSFRTVNPCSRELLPWRLRRLGMDPEITRSASYRDLERVCAACTAWQVCAYDLAKGRVQAGMRSYCLNARTIDALSRGIASW